MDAREILVDHLRHALQQLQRYLAFGFAAALMLLAFAVSPTTGAGALPTPIGELSVNGSLAPHVYSPEIDA